MGTFSKVATLTACIIVAGVLSCSTARAEMVDRIVANVNGEIILYSELQEQIKVHGEIHADPRSDGPGKEGAGGARCSQPDSFVKNSPKKKCNGLR